MESKSHSYRTYLDCFIGSLLLLSTLAFFSFIALFAKEEGTLGTNPIMVFLADTFVYLFPLVPLISKPSGGFLMFFVAFGINILFYALAIATLLYQLFRRSGRYKAFNFSNMSFYVIVAIFTLILIRLYATAD